MRKMIETLLIIGAASSVLYYAGDYVYHEYLKDTKGVPMEGDGYTTYDSSTSEVASLDSALYHVNITNGQFQECGKIVRQTILRYLDDPSRCDQNDFTFNIGKARIKYGYSMGY